MFITDWKKTPFRLKSVIFDISSKVTVGENWRKYVFCVWFMQQKKLCTVCFPCWKTDDFFCVQITQELLNFRDYWMFLDLNLSVGQILLSWLTSEWYQILNVSEMTNLAYIQEKLAPLDIFMQSKMFIFLLFHSFILFTTFFIPQYFSKYTKSSNRTCWAQQRV